MLKEDDVVFCKVTKIEGASVFLEIEGEAREGTMMMSEVAAGRIRNLRDYISVGRKIVCKVLRIFKDHVEMSLRRVTTKERENVLDNYKKERALASVLKVVGEDDVKIIAKIKLEYDIGDFFEDARSDPKLFEKFLAKDKAEKVAKIFGEKTTKKKEIKRKINLVSFSGEGVDELKEILDFSDKEVEIHYLGSGNFSLLVKGDDFKVADGKMEEILKEIEGRAGKKGVAFELRKEGKK